MIGRDYYHAKMIGYLRQKNMTCSPLISYSLCHFTNHALRALRRVILAEMKECGIKPNNWTYKIMMLSEDHDSLF